MKRVLFPRVPADPPPPRSPAPPPFVTETAGGAVLNVRAQPRASRPGLDGVVGDAVKVRVRAAPVDGKANRELVETLADAFGLPKSRVALTGGETSKTKRVLLAGLSAAAVAAALRPAGDPGGNR